MQAEITTQVKGVGSTFASSDAEDNQGENFISTKRDQTEEQEIP